MSKKFILALMLASGMAFAQTGGTGSTPDQSQPSQQPTSPSTSSPSTDQSSQTATPTSTSDQQTSLKGCLKQSGGNWVLNADNGQSVNLSGDSSALKPHDGHQVQVQGTRGSDGSLQVSSINMISDSCTSNQASAAPSSDSSAAAATTGAAAGAATGAATTDSASANQSAATTSSPAGASA